MWLAIAQEIVRLRSILATGSTTAENDKRLNCNNFEECVDLLRRTHESAIAIVREGQFQSEMRKSLQQECEKKLTLKDQECRQREV